MKEKDKAEVPPVEASSAEFAPNVLFEISRILMRRVEISGALLEVSRLLEDSAHFSSVKAALLNRKTGLLHSVDFDAAADAEKPERRIKMGEGLEGRVFETGEIIVINNADNEEINYCVPIKHNDVFLGTLRSKSGAKNGVREKADLELLEKTAALLADAIWLRRRVVENAISNAVLKDAVADSEIKAQKNEKASEASLTIGEGSCIIGTSSIMRELYGTLCQVAPSGATVLVTGESGTGKELVAAEIKRLSPRNDAPFVKINCAALPESIIESELFGHEKGAFTGALAKRAGKFENANSGTVFLDEIGELPPQIQVKLLRVLQEREFERVGGSETVKIDVRLIAATNKNLEDEVKNGRFREDLYYRLNVFPVIVPPLRERKSDILLLADYFAEKYAQRNGKIVKRISSLAIDLLAAYHWPGNVRELENCIERAVILTQDMVIHSYHLPPSLQSARSTHTEPPSTLDSALSRLEKEMIVEALKLSGGNTARGAQSLGISERQMGLRLRHYGIDWRVYRKR